MELFTETYLGSKNLQKQKKPQGAKENHALRVAIDGNNRLHRSSPSFPKTTFFQCVFQIRCFEN